MSPPPGNIQLSSEEFEALLSRLARQTLEPEDYELLIQLVQAMGWLSHELEDKKLSIRRLQRIFGIQTESARNILNDDDDDGDSGGKPGKTGGSDTLKKKKRKGHGRYGAADYTGAEQVQVELDTFQPGAPCPSCPNGRLYELSTPGTVIRVTGQPPLRATIYELQKYRCNLCGLVLTAPLPDGVSDTKYDETASAMLALLRYGGGFP